MVYPIHSVDDDVKKIYVFDKVYKFDDKRNQIVYGSVEDTYGDDLTVLDNCEELQRGQIRVRWSDHVNGVEEGPEICEQSDVTLMYRKITTGQTYRKKQENGMMTQKGLCTEIKQIATVRIGCKLTDESTSALVQHVDVNRFYTGCLFDVDDAVSFGDKVGRIKSVDRLLRLKSEKCDSIIKVSTGMNEDQISDSYRTCDHESEQKPYRFYETVECIPASLVDPVWILKSETMNMEIKQKFLIESFEIVSVQVYWTLPDGSIEIGEVEGDDVKKLNVFHSPQHDVIQYENFMMETKPNDDLIEMSTWRKQWSDRLFQGLFPDKGNKEEEEEEKEEFDCDSTLKSNEDSTSQDKNNSTSQGHDDSTLQSDDDCVEKDSDCSSEDHEVSTSLTDHVPAEADVWVVHLETQHATVIWQDGTVEQVISCAELHPCDNDDYEFFPGDIVMLKESEEKVWGVVQSVDGSERVAKVLWSDHELGCPCSSCEQSPNFHLTEHSVYNLVDHDQFEFYDGIVHKSTTNGAMLGTIMNSVPQNGCRFAVKWSDGSTEYCLPGRGFKKLQGLESLENQLEAQSRSSTDDGNKNESRDSNAECENLSEAVDNEEPLVDENEGFCLLDEVSDKHFYYSNGFELKNMQKFTVALHREYKLLEGSLPSGVWVRAYGDRTDLLSVMIRGPEDTPYEDGLFLFDIQLPADYPENPPRVHFISFVNKPLNPNLYVEGTVCLSLLGTWKGKDCEVWSTHSNLLQVIVSIQGLILVAEPYYNEPGYETARNTQEGHEESRTYNESVILNVLNSMKALLNNCPQEFKSAMLSHFKKNGEKICRRIEGYCDGESDRHKYPSLPVSKGLKLSLECQIVRLRKTLTKVCGGSEPSQLSI